MTGRRTQTFRVDNSTLFRSQALYWAQLHDHFHYFTDNGISYPYGGFSHFLAIGAEKVCPISPGQTFESLQDFHTLHTDWVIGYFSYDLKNEIENLQSRHPDRLQFPPVFFYTPKHLVFFPDQENITIHSFEDPETIFERIYATPLPAPGPAASLLVRSRTAHAHYLRNAESIREHILDGDVYELNYCIEFYAENAQIAPLATYEALNARSPMPFSVYGKTDSCYLLCASPERFLKKDGLTLISQPIKGTARRGIDPKEDAALKYQLQQDEKERAENMMIVDLVRNDLARSARTGTVRVEEMFGIYTFAQLHQMISTVSAKLRPEVAFTTAIKNAFPMGSMTGAPKIKAMELIDEYEDTRRGLFSGAVGYITPEGNFDFNVVIRSLLYNTATRYLSFQVGSAITYDAQGEKEYEECLLKARAMREVLGDQLL